MEKAIAPAATVPSGHMRAFVDALEHLGFDRALLMSAARVEAATLADPDAMVQTSAIGDILCSADDQRRMPNLGLRIACEIPVGAFPLIDYLVVTSENVGEGVHALARYLAIAGAQVSITLREDETPIQIAMEGSPFNVEYMASLIICHLRRETAGRFVPDFVSFTHMPNDTAEFEQLLQCPVRISASWSGVAVARSSWNAPLLRRDPVLRRLLHRQAEEIRSSAPNGEDVVSQARRALIARTGADMSIDRIAADLNTTPRTLQRRLGCAGESYDRLRTSVLRETAQRCLTSDQLSIGEIAYFLGYSEPGAFHRAFKRWTGSTPQTYRASHRGEREKDPE